MNKNRRIVPQKVGTSIKGGDVKIRHQKVETSKSKKKVGRSPQVGTSKKVGTSIDVPTFLWLRTRKTRERPRESRREDGRGMGGGHVSHEYHWMFAILHYFFIDDSDRYKEQLDCALRWALGQAGLHPNAQRRPAGFLRKCIGISMPFCCTQGSAEVRARCPVASVWESRGRHALPLESSRAPSKKCFGFHVFVMI